MINFYPLDDLEGDTAKDIINGNDGNYGEKQDYSTFISDTSNP